MTATTPADPSRRSSQELFQIEIYRIPHKFGDLKFAVKTCYQKYLGVDTKKNTVRADKPLLDDNCLFIIRAARLGSLTEFMQDTPFSHLVNNNNRVSIITSTDNESVEPPQRTPSNPPSKSSPKSASFFGKKFRDSWMSLFAS